MLLGRLMATVLCLAGAAVAAGPQLTTIQDTIYKADGTRMNATAVITWNSFEAGDASNVGTQTVSVSIVNGALFVKLVPNTNAAQISPYTVSYSSDGRIQYQETWMVPPSSTPLRVRDVRTGATSGPPPINTGGSSGNDTSIPQSSVTGLVNDLAARPLKGPGYGTSRTAVVDQNGAVNTAVGNSTDCMHVDGTSSACVATTDLPGYGDAETPGGTVDGANGSFTLSLAPAPVQSLLLFRNGVAQKLGADFTLSGSTLTFVSGNLPQPGDTLLAWYRTGVSSVPVSGGLTAGPSQQIVCSMAGGTVATANLTSLDTCTIPAGTLVLGDRIEIRFTLAHTGTAGGFTYLVKWGTTAAMQRTAGAGDATVGGTIDASIAVANTVLTGTSFGTLLTLLPSTAVANASVQAAVTIDVQAGLASATADSVTLVNYTVLRYPAN